MLVLLLELLRNCLIDFSLVLHSIIAVRDRISVIHVDNLALVTTSWDACIACHLSLIIGLVILQSTHVSTHNTGHLRVFLCLRVENRVTVVFNIDIFIKLLLIFFQVATAELGSPLATHPRLNPPENFFLDDCFQFETFEDQCRRTTLD